VRGLPTPWTRSLQYPAADRFTGPESQAPPRRDRASYMEGIVRKTRALSATNNPDDNLRKRFILATLRKPWEDLLSQGLFLVHSVKCAITDKDRHQNPPDDVVATCAPPHFVQEVLLLRPPRVVVFGKAPYRALLKVPGTRAPRGLGISASVADLVDKARGGLEFQTDGWKFHVHVSPFPLQHKRPVPLAQEVLREAATLAGVLAGPGSQEVRVGGLKVGRVEGCSA
jgi:hypothetical protein